MRPIFLRDADTHYRTGLVLTAIAAILYVLPGLWSSGAESVGTFGIFMLNYGIAVVYAIWLFIRRAWKNIPVFLVLFLISAYSLNRDISVFELSVTWLSCVLVLYSVALLLLPVMDAIPGWLQAIVSVLTGAALMLFLYMALYVTPLYLFSLPTAVLMGVSLHTYVPLLIVIYLLWKIVRMAKKDKACLWGIFAGIGVSVAIAAVFIVQWRQIDAAVDRAYQHSLIADKDDIPGWVRVAQRLPEGALVEKYLKHEMVYTTYEDGGLSLGWNVPQKNFDEPRQHDPLVFIAGMFCVGADLPPEDRLKILEAMYVSGHQMQDRLWSGANLRTSKVISNVRIWPHQRLAYTEKTITVANTGGTCRWCREEAIYTFHLPEGGIVTSLSLWINGREQKGILTTRQKADSAYKEIVGVENRDPSVVHWQEGNTVSVRVFPVEAASSRVFKVGITAPLTYDNGTLRYDNVWFEGPDNGRADELCQVEWAGMDKDPEMQGFTKNAGHRYEQERPYKEHWTLETKDPGYSPEVFLFDGKAYSMRLYEKRRMPATVRTIYLDVNAEWSAAEVEQVMAAVKGADVYVYDGNMVKITSAGEDVERLRKLRFSLFPFHLVADPATSLVITKSTLYSPSLKALADYPFADDLAHKMSSSAPLRLFNLGKELSLYHRTLKEHRVFEYEQGDMALLKQLLSTGTFAQSIENDSTVVVDNAMIQLSRTNSDGMRNGGIDHIMRLFAYDHIMLGLKGNLFPDRYTDSNFVAEAEQAYVVTPVSSLVVLETQADYDRFGIKKGMNTLDNATLKNNGAVPEPHEWALIALALITVTWAFLHKRRIKTG